MEQMEDLVMMLSQMPSPAFFVKDGLITHANDAALGHTIALGTPIGDLLATGQTEYSELQSGCLYLTLNISGIECAASVTKVNDFDYFILEQDEDLAELQSMALAARELRNPLASVMTVTNRLFPLSSPDEDSATQEMIARINKGLFQMLRIVSNMSDAYRYRQGSAPCLETRDIGSILAELFQKAAPLVQYAGIELHFENMHQTVFSLVDAQMLERAVQNMLSNALKFSPKGSTINAKLNRRGNMLYLTVENSDPECSGSFPGNVYLKYQREPSLEDCRFGIGLGMVLIRSAATAHGGTVLLEQSAGRGTRITMSLAIHQPGDSNVRSSIIQVDYTGEWDHALVELSESLPLSLYSRDNIN